MGLVTSPSGAAPTLWQAMVHTMKRLAGMPDYAAYLDHLRCCHPGREAPSEREYFDEFIRLRYGRGEGRCC